MKKYYNNLLAALLLIGAGQVVQAQGLTLPPSGDNQKSTVIQNMGLVKVSIDYSSPNVTGPGGEDRKGKIWGELVPWGLVNLGFGTAKESPWRAGANENTVFSISHDILVEGKKLAAGKYGLFIATAENGPWTVIFSKNSSSWGSYFYDPSEDALRVEVNPLDGEYNEWLTFGFENRELESCTAFLKWENKKVPIRLKVEDINSLYLAGIRNELRGSAGFTWNTWVNAVQFCVNNKINLEEALAWADFAISAPFVGQENFTTLSTKAQVLSALDKKAESDEVMKKAIDHPTASVNDIHQYGRSLIVSGKNQQALEVFKLNRQKHPEDTFTTYVGLGRGYAAVGDKKNAIKNWELAIRNLPENQKANLSFYEAELKKVKEM